MLRNITLRVAALLLVAAGTPAHAQMALTADGRAKAQIILRDTCGTCREAATLLERFVAETSGAHLPLYAMAPESKGSIIIGEATDCVPTDGYVLDCHDGLLRILSGGGKGAVYGVTDLLERYLGVGYWAYDAYTLRPAKDISLPAFHHEESPAFSFRQTHSYGNDDPVYYDWMRLNNQREVFAGGLWVHTFDQIMPASIYGQAHPEYYSMINGERRPGNHSQLCLTNPDVLEIMAAKVDSIFRANPGMSLISISQNDGNHTYCQCPACKAVDDEEGSPAGNYIRFVNRLAERFPDKEFSTLAYLFTMNPPAKTRPLKNVNIMLCDIDCRREVPLTDNASGREFMKALEGWSAISDNIFVWDYCINFDNMVSPFPNFHILGPNLRTFRQHHARMVFEQANGARQRGTDFGEMRAWILSKLMWNPDQDTDSLMQVFLQGYYGAAAPYLYRYQMALRENLARYDVPLWIYDSPVSHKDGMLCDSHVAVYDELFDQAEQAVRDDSTLLARVETARLPLRYSKLEIARTRQGGNAEKISKDLETFRSVAASNRVTSLNENLNPVEGYCQLYRKRFLPRPNTNKAAGAKVSWRIAPAPRYQKIASTALTDGLYGGTTFVESWVGWEGSNADFVLDLGKQKAFSKVTADFLHQLGQWVLLPRSVTVSYSKDGKDFRPMGKFTFAEDRDRATKFASAVVALSSEVKARYVRIEIEGLGMCPSWHYGVGYPAWFFLDEVTVE